MYSARCRNTSRTLHLHILHWWLNMGWRALYLLILVQNIFLIVQRAKDYITSKIVTNNAEIIFTAYWSKIRRPVTLLDFTPLYYAISWALSLNLVVFNSWRIAPTKIKSRDQVSPSFILQPNIVDKMSFHRAIKRYNSDHWSNGAQTTMRVWTKKYNFSTFFETAPYHFVRMAHQRYSFSIAFKKQ